MHGSYINYGCNNELAETGFYKLGLKDSIWQGQMYKGTYTKGKKTGVWEYMDFEGRLIQKFDHDKHELVFYKVEEYDTSHDYAVIRGKDTLHTRLDRPPMLIGGYGELFNIILDHQTNLKKIMKKSDSGHVVIAFNLDSNCNYSNIRFTTTTQTDFNGEAMKMLEESRSLWMPALLNNTPVTVTKVMTATYSVRRVRFRHEGSVFVNFW